MKPSNFHLQIGKYTLSGIWAILLTCLVAIPLLALIGLILSFFFSVLGILFIIFLTIIIFMVIIRLITRIMPANWYHKLNNLFHFKYSNQKILKPKTTPDGKPIIDVNFKEDHTPPNQ